jgi:hypothetical protein
LSGCFMALATFEGCYNELETGILP